MAKKDYYEILGVNKNATEAEIKSAFRKKAKEYHPDVNKDPGAADKFKEIGEAYSIIGDASKRKQYDQFGSAAFENNGAGGGFGGFDFSGFSFDDFDLGSIFEQFMGGGFSSSRRGSQRATRGEDLLVRLNLTFEEAVFGCVKEFDVSVNTTCPDCDGEGGHEPETCSKCGGRGRVLSEQRTILGIIQTETSCPYCRGVGKTYKSTCQNCKAKGYIKKNKTINLRVPSGIDNEDQMRMSGKGSAGTNGGPNGDIYIDFRVKPHPLFKREGKHIYLDLPLTITEATLGCIKKIPTINGVEKININPGTQNGEKIKLKGKGINDEKSRSLGDMFLITKIIIPTKLDRKQKNLFKDLENTDLDNDSIFRNFNKYI